MSKEMNEKRSFNVDKFYQDLIKQPLGSGGYVNRSGMGSGAGSAMD